LLLDTASHKGIAAKLLPHLHVISCAVTQQYERAARVTLARICSSTTAIAKRSSSSTAAISHLKWCTAE
jgi:hypothetical protein